MADSAVAITAGAGTNVDTRTEATNGDHRQVVVIGDPSVTNGVASVGTNGAVSAAQLDSSAAVSIAANSTSSGTVTGASSLSGAAIQLTGTWTATLQVQFTVDGTNWINMSQGGQVMQWPSASYATAGNITAVGVYLVSLPGAVGVRVITTAYTSGTIVGTVRAFTNAPWQTSIAGSLQPATLADGVTVTNQSVSSLGSLSYGANSSGTWDRIRVSSTTDANAATSLLNNAAQKFNGLTWDRDRSGSYTVNVDTSSARTATGNGTAWVNYSGAGGLWVWINVTAVSGTSPSCTFKLQWSPDNGTTWIDWDTTNLQTTAVTATGTKILKVGTAQTTAANAALKDNVARQVRLSWTISGTTPSFTFATWYTATGS